MAAARAMTLTPKCPGVNDVAVASVPSVGAISDHVRGRKKEKVAASAKRDRRR